MRQDCRGVGPQPRGHQLLVFARGEVDQAVDAAANPRDIAGLLVMCQQRVGIAGSRSLARRKESFLGGGDVVEPPID